MNAAKISREDLDAARNLYAAMLRPCPFCAGRIVPQDDQIQFAPALLAGNPDPYCGFNVWQIRCWGCSASMAGMTAKAVAEAWNRRAP